MPVINRTALVMYSAEQMFDLVNDVAAYPDFIADCDASDILEQSDTHMVAHLHLRKSGFSYQFVTRNQLERPSRIILALEQGALQHLHGYWQFSPLREDACKVEMQLDFGVSGIAGKAVSSVLTQVAGGLVDSFCQRAKVVYGAK